MHLHVQSASFAFADAAPIIHDASFTLSLGWTGLVGPNGAGKTTLLRLLTGELQATRGQIRVAPDDLRIESCAQELPEPTPALFEFAQSHERLAHRVRAALRLTSIERWPTLSPGERKRWQIGTVVATEPDVLLLDEPTNHLDREARSWLLEALRMHRGIGVIVSHDRALLDQLTTHTLRVSDARATCYAGAYTQAHAEWELEAEHQREARLDARARVRELKDRVQSARVAQRGAAANKKTRNRMRNAHDSDARTIGAQTKADWADAVHGRKLEVVSRELSRAERDLGELRVQKQLGNPVFAGFAPAPAATIGFIEHRALIAGDQTLLDLPSLTLHRDDRVWIAGPNGAGKSTLLRLLVEHVRLPRQDILALPQEISAPAALSLLGELRELDPQARGRVLTIVASLGVDPDRLLVSEQPSPGEARKLLLAMGFARHARALVLDEPENHLDVPSIERVEAALSEYPGALYLVTHDALLAQRCTNQRWNLDPNGLTVADVEDRS
jgi:ATPase subunit of ABC transporter with duplicated ATPase domains